MRILFIVTSVVVVVMILATFAMYALDKMVERGREKPAEGAADVAVAPQAQAGTRAT